jgi:ABC-type branched-subunit amino acid transport system ATPase component/ABC-type branched-subunit amino acid transport system permease subunit
MTLTIDSKRAAVGGNKRKWDVLGPLVGFVVFLAALSFVQDRYLARLIALVIFWGALATTWNWIGGFAGQLSLGHAAFVGLGAYLGYILENEFGIPPWFALIGAIPLGAVAAIVIGAPTLRLTGVFFSLATVVFPITLQLLFTYWGFQEALIPPRPDHPTLHMQWTDPRAYAVIFAALLLLYWLGTVALMRSQWRYYLAAIRQDHIAAESVGIDIWRVKLITFIMSGCAACMLGVVYAQMLFVLTPDTVLGVNVSLQAMVLSLVGGIGRLFGPILGTLIVVPITQALEARFESYPGLPQLVYGLMLIVVIVAIPDGVISGLQQLPWLARFFRSRSGPIPVSHSPAFSPAPVIETSVAPKPQPRVPGEVVLRVDTVRKAYGGVVAVNDVSFSVTRGEFLGIVGPNGAGKTTLFDLLTGFQRPGTGTIHLKAGIASKMPPYQLARVGLRRTFQVPRPFPSLNVYENVLLGALLVQDRLSVPIEQVVERALEAVGLTERADSPAGLLTPSQIRLLEVARALAGQPDMLLLDEPLAGLDPSEMQELIVVLQKLHQDGLTIVMVDHAIAIVSKIVERMIVLDNGKLIADGPADEVTRFPRVVEAYLGSRWRDA